MKSSIELFTFALVCLLTFFNRIYAEQAESAQAQVTPTEVTAGSPLQQFTYTIQPSGGTLDSISIENPFVDYEPTITGIVIDSSPHYIKIDNDRPSDSGFVHWNYSDINNELIILCYDSSVTNSIIITFYLSIPTGTGGNFNFVSAFDDVSGPQGEIACSEVEWTVSITPGTLSGIFIENQPDGSGQEITELTLTADETIMLYSIGRDLFGNFREPAQSSWEIIGGSGQVLPSSNSSSTEFTPEKIGNMTIRATSAALVDETGLITVTPGNVTHVVIEANSGGMGTVIGNIDLPADSTLTAWAIGYDQNLNYVREIVDADWSGTGGLFSLSGSGSFFTLDPTTSEISGTLRADSSGLIGGETGTINIIDGDLAEIKITDGPGENADEVEYLHLTTNDDILLYSAGYDNDGNFLRNVNCQWSDSGGIGHFEPTSGISSRFYADTTGNGAVIADSSWLHDYVYTEVSDGEIDYIIIRTAANGGGEVIGDTVISADTSLILYAAGYDENDNYVREVNAIWSQTGDLYPLPTNGEWIIFSPITSDVSGFISADSVGLTGDNTGTITVTDGDIAEIRIMDGPGESADEVDFLDLTADEDTLLYSAGYDNDGNFLWNVNCQWSDSGGIGHFEPASGISSRFYADKTGHGNVQADSIWLHDYINTLVKPGELAIIRLRDQAGGLGDVIGSLTMTTDSSLTIFAAGYDIDNNFIKDTISSWSVNGLQVEDLSSLEDSSVIYSPSVPGESGYIFASALGTSVTGNTGTITIINPPILVYVPGSMTPDIVMVNNSQGFSIQVKNIGGRDVALNTSSVFTFSDNNIVFEANLSTETEIMEGSTEVLSFNAESIPEDFEAGTYTPYFNSVGIDEESNYFQQDSIKTGINELNIVKIDIEYMLSEREEVERGCDSMNIFVAIRNYSTLPVDSVSGSIEFTGTPGNFNFEPIFIEIIQPGSLSIDTLNGSVGEHTLGPFIIDASISGKIEGISIFDNNATIKDTITVETQSQLVISDYPGTEGINPEFITVGQGNIDLRFLVENNGTSDANIDSARVIFYHGADTADGYIVNQAQYTNLIAGDTSGVEISFAVNATSLIEIEDSIDIWGEVYWRDEHTDISFNEKKLIHKWFVYDRILFKIEDIVCSVDTVSSLQTTPWHIDIVTSDSSYSSIELTEATLQFFEGNDVNNTFNYITPEVFQLSQTNIINDGETDTLRFVIEQTGLFRSNENLSIRAAIRGRDISTDYIVGDNSTGSVVLVDTAHIDVTYACASQPQANLNQEDGRLVLTFYLKNSGGAPLHFTESLLSPDRLYFCSSTDEIINSASTDEIILYPTDMKIEPGEIDSISFKVSNTGGVKGSISAGISLAGIDLHDYQKIYNYDLNKSKFTVMGDIFTVVEPAYLYVNNLKRSTEKDVTAGNKFEVKVHINNSGEEKIENILLQISSKYSTFNNSESSSFDTTIVSLQGGRLKEELNFILDAPDFSITDTLTIGIASAVAKNTGSLLTNYGQRTINLSIPVIGSAPPLIDYVRYIDGGYDKIPDGKINKDDLILIKFDKEVSGSRYNVNASRVFSIIGEEDRLFTTDTSYIISPESAGYSGSDADSLLFIQLGNDPVLANSSASNRKYIGDGSDSFTRVRFQYSPSMLVIDPGIEEGLLKGVSSNDAGYSIYRDTLSYQIKEIANFNDNNIFYNKYCIVVDDGIPPHIVNRSPINLSASGNKEYISKYSDVKAFITGRNLVSYDTLKTDLTNLFSESLANVFLKDYSLLSDSLSELIDQGNQNAREFIEEYKNKIKIYENPNLIYDRIKNKNSDPLYTINPLAQMFTPLNFDAIEYTYSDSPSPVSNFSDVPDSADAAFDETEQVIPPDNIAYNTVVKYSSARDELGSGVYTWFNIPNSFGVSYVDSVFFRISDKPDGLKSSYGYVLLAGPNPFDPVNDNGLSFQYELSNDHSRAEILIIDSAGRLVNKIECSEAGQGKHTAPQRWNGRNFGGKIVSRGIYLSVLEVGGSEARASFIIVVK